MVLWFLYFSFSIFEQRLRFEFPFLVYVFICYIVREVQHCAMCQRPSCRDRQIRIKNYIWVSLTALILLKWSVCLLLPDNTNITIICTKNKLYVNFARKLKMGSESIVFNRPINEKNILCEYFLEVSLE